MIITISLVNTHHFKRYKIKEIKKKKIFPVMRTLRIYSLNKFHI